MNFMREFLDDLRLGLAEDSFWFELYQKTIDLAT